MTIFPTSILNKYIKELGVIDKTDEAIDQMIYGLDGLSKEEIKIMEGK